VFPAGSGVGPVGVGGGGAIAARGGCGPEGLARLEFWVGGRVRGREGRGGGGCEEGDADVIGEAALVIDCGREVVGHTPLAIDEEAEVVGACFEGDPGEPDVVRIGFSVASMSGEEEEKEGYYALAIHGRAALPVVVACASEHNRFSASAPDYLD
jgi:hypothetical protein